MQARALFRHIENTYHAQAEYLWQGFPDYAIFRAPNRKWFALYMPNIPAAALSLAEEKTYAVLNVKIDPQHLSALSLLPCIRPAYHMNKAHWVSILADEAADDLLLELIAGSYHLLCPD